MKLFVANTTRQNQQFHYRVPEVPKIMIAEIPIGSQVRIYKDDASSQDVNSIITQLESYGAVNADSIRGLKSFAGLCYSVDKPVASDAIVRVIDRNDEVLEARGYETRQQAAVAVNNRLAEDGDLRDGVSVQFQEEGKRGEDRADKMDQTIIVSRDANAPPMPRRRKGG